MKTIADITGNNAVHRISTDGQIIATSVYLGATGGPARIGDANVGAARGASIEADKITVLPPKTSIQGGYPLAQLYAYVPTGTTLSITYDDE